MKFIISRNGWVCIYKSSVWSATWKMKWEQLNSQMWTLNVNRRQEIVKSTQRQWSPWYCFWAGYRSYPQGRINVKNFLNLVTFSLLVVCRMTYKHFWIQSNCILNVYWKYAIDLVSHDFSPAFYLDSILYVFSAKLVVNHACAMTFKNTLWLIVAQLWYEAMRTEHLQELVRFF